MRSFRLSFVVVVLGLTLIGPAGAAVLNVNTPMDDFDMVPGDGSCISGTIGMCTLRAAIQEANATASDDVIVLPAGDFTLTLAGIDDAAATGDLDVHGNLVIIGQGADVTIIDGNGLDRVFDLLDGGLELYDLTVTGGNATASNGENGGGIRSNGNRLWIGSCHFTDNVATQAGAVYGSQITSLLIWDSVFAGNTTQVGLINTWGAAIRAEGALTLLRSTVTGNFGVATSDYAVDVACYTGSVSIRNSSIVDNQSSGLKTSNCDTSVVNTTIYGNASMGLTLQALINPRTMTVTNSIIANQDDGLNCFTIAPGSVTFDHCLDSGNTCGLNSSAGDLVMTDPVLLPLRNWGGLTPTMYPKPGVSPVVDAGSAAACESVDQRGVRRGGDGNLGCDMGAVEAGDLVFFDDFEDGTTNAW